MFKLTFFVCLWGSSLTLTTAEIKNLIGEPDYRKVKLHWETDGSSDDFQIRYCELQSWGAQRCRIQVVDDSQSNFIEDGVATYTTDVSGLRMATTYSFEVKRKNKEAGIREDRADGDDKNQNIIVIPTKGFSAKATQCLPHASEIEVQTGPYFGGRIAVEATDGERCAIDGEPNSQRDSYILRINHLECGSQVNDTTVATFVIVQENLPILTHSTRRFLVLCTYQPETLTVRAGINLPSNRGHGYANVALEDNSMRQARSRTGRLLQAPQALVHQEDFHEIKEPEDNNVLPIALIAVLMVAVIAGFVAIVLKWNLKRIQDDFDNVSMASDLSTTSYATSTNVEVVNERRQ